MNASGTRNAFHLINAHANSLPIRKGENESEAMED